MPGTAENERMRKMLQEMLAALEAESAARTQQEGASQAAFASVLDRRILGEDEADADAVMRRRDQSRAQLPAERQAFAAGTDDGSSRDELANYAMIMRQRRGGGAPVRPMGRGDEAGFERDFRSAMSDDSRGFDEDFARHERVNQRMTDMFGGQQRVSEMERQRILAEMAKGANAQMAATAGAPSSAAAFGSLGGPPDTGALDEAALRERSMR